MTSDQHLPSGDRDGRGADLRHLQLRVDGLDHAHRGRRRHHGGPGELGRWRHGSLYISIIYIIYAMLLLGRGPGLRGLQRGQRDEGVRVPAVLPDHADQGPAQHRRR